MDYGFHQDLREDPVPQHSLQGARATAFESAEAPRLNVTYSNVNELCNGSRG